MIDVILTPSALPDSGLENAQVVVFDVLRATTSITAGLFHGAKDVQLFGSLDEARAAKKAAGTGPFVLAGESKCLRPDDFDLGNSPREFVTEKVGGSSILLATTNGTRAAVAAQNAERLFAGSLLNAEATAKALLPRLDHVHTLLLCAGTNGQLACEDVIGAGAVLFTLLQTTYRADLPFTDSAWMAYHTFAAVRERLPAALRLGQGGINVIEAGLEDDIDFSARLNACPIVCEIQKTPSLRVVKI